MAPRERILAAAQEMFYRHGIRAVGVDAIAEAAGTNKMTLYRHFASKDLLVAAYLQMLAAEGDAMWDANAALHPNDPRAQLLDWLRGVAAGIAEPGGRGCPLANAAVELADPDHPGRRVIEAHKRAQREKLVALCRAARCPDHPDAAGSLEAADELADEMFLLIEGAQVSAQSIGPGGPGARLLRLAESLMAHAG